MKTKYITGSVAAITTALLAPLAARASKDPTTLHITSLKDTPTDAGAIITNFTNVLLTAAGIISVIMIIVGGIMYSLSAGDSSKGTKAKDTILYAVIGLVITTLAYAIVNFVIKAF